MKGKRVSSTLMCAALILTLLPAVTITAEAGEVCGDLTVTTDKSLGTDYTYAAHVLTFTSPGDYTVSMTTPGAATAADTVAVTGGTAADPVNITLTDVRIEHDRTTGGCAFSIASGAVVRLTLSGSNTLHSGGTNAGIECPPTASLTLGGTGTLQAVGGWVKSGSNASGAGIGGSGDMSCGDVTIESGVIKAVGGELAAGIGGGGGGSSGGSGGEITITGGSVTALGGVGELGQPSNGCGAGIGGGTCSSGGTVNIIGGTVTAAGGGVGGSSNSAAGIGGGFSGSGGAVNISGGTVTATGGTGGAAGIGGGGGDGASVTISGGTVTAAGGGAGIGGGFSGTAGTTVISGGSVNASSGGIQGTPTNGTANGNANVFLTTVTLSGAADKTAVSALTTDAGYPYGANGMLADASGKVYLYLPDTTSTLDAQTASVCYTGKVTADDAASVSGTLVPGALTVTGGSYTYPDHVLTLTGGGNYTVSMRSGITSTTADRIAVTGGTATDPVNITLTDVHIEHDRATGGCAFSISPGAVVRLTLSGRNTLQSGGTNAGIECPPTASLTLGGSGALQAVGGQVPANPSGAGIGGSGDMSGGDVIIESGVIEAVGGFNSAGIGGSGSGGSGSGGKITIINGSVTAFGGVTTLGSPGTGTGAGIGGGGGGGGGTVTISGGTVEATSGNGGGDWGGAGIGGGHSGGGGTVTISGGTVIATATGGGAGIGGGDLPGGLGSPGGSGSGGAVTITGGTVTATSNVHGAGIGGGNGGAAGTTVILGGSVNASGGVAIQDTPTNGTANGNANVSLSTVTIPGIAATEITGLIVEGAAYYGVKDLKTDASGTLYLWLPAGAAAAQTRTADTIYTYNSTSGAFEADTAPPSVTGVTPSGSGAALSGSITVTFSEEMRTGAGTVSYAPSGGGYTQLASGSWSADNTVYTAAYSGLQPGTQYTVKAEGFMDYSGNTMVADASHKFTTAAATTTTSDYSVPGYTAVVADGGNLTVKVDQAGKSAAVDIGAQLGGSMSGGGNVTVTMPSIPGVTNYTLGILLAYLSTPGGTGTLTFTTETGSMTLPADMLAGVPGAEGMRAEITIGLGDKKSLPDAVKDAIGDRPLLSLSLSVDGKQTAWSNPGAPVTVSIPYTPTAEELAHPESIVIWYIDGSGKAVSVPNGHYNPETGTVTFSVTHFSLFAVGYNKVVFSDVAAGTWYETAVSFIAARGVTGGTGDGYFCPDALLTRGDFLVMLMRACGISPDATPTDNFSDAGDTYYTGYLAAAKRLGIAGGVGDNMFAPHKEITRQEMFTLLYNALKQIGQLPQGNSGKALSDFTDAGSVASWAKDALTLLVETGTVGGSEDKLNPSGTATRAEMAQTLYRLLGQ